MDFRRILPALALVLCAVPAKGQLLKDIDMLLKNNQARQKYDTTYIYRPQERFLVRTQSLFSGESLALGCRIPDEGDFNVAAGTGLQFKQSFGIGYRSIVLDAGFVPGEKKSVTAGFKINGNRFGFSAGGSFSFGMSGNASSDDIIFPVPEGGLIGAHAYANAYFAFNGRRFSMPAATNQNYRQLRSAGSLLATVSAQMYGMAPNQSIIPDPPTKAAFTSLLGIGGGYGYNWVPDEHWLVHASLTETVGFLNRSTIVLADDSKVDFKGEIPVFATEGNLAVLYYWRKWYFGLHAKADNLLFFGDKDVAFLIDRIETAANLTVGVRF